MSGTRQRAHQRLHVAVGALAFFAACRAGSLSGSQDAGGAPTVTPTSPNDLAPAASAPGAAGPSTSTGGLEPNAPLLPVDAANCPTARGRRIAVGQASQLAAALADARPGDVIALADGTYGGTFVAAAAASSDAPITLCGSALAVLQGPSLTLGYTLHLQGAQYWHLIGFSVTGGAKGVMLDGAGHNILSRLTIHGTGSEGLHLRTASSDNVVDGCHVYDTGIAGDPMYGEGIYIGSSQNNWCALTAGQADRSDRNVVQHCTVAQTTAEAIDVKEGTSAGQLLHNILDGKGIQEAAATSLINIKGNGYIVQGNQLSHAPQDAISLHVLLPGWGACNHFVANGASDALPGYGVHVAAPKPWPRVEVTADNQFPLAASGATNAEVGVQAPSADSCDPGTAGVPCPG